VREVSGTHRLEVSDSAIQEWLKGIVAKARRLGLDRVVRLTEPEYLHVLVGAVISPRPSSIVGVPGTGAWSPLAYAKIIRRRVLSSTSMSTTPSGW
jgi:hypothetical protein